MKLSVLIPVYNERATLAEILLRVQQVEIDKELIVVDNCSTDGTRQDLEALLASGQAVSADLAPSPDSESGRLRIAFQARNEGKGSSVRRALSLARGEWVVVQDADLEYDPNDLLKLFAAADANSDAKAVFGSRLNDRLTRQGQPRTAFYYGRVGLSFVFRILYFSPLSDVATCYKLLRRDLAQSLGLAGTGFDLDFEIPAKLARRGVRIYEVPISYAPRTELEGKKIRPVHDGVRAVWTLLKYRFVQ